jgi:hypothetical protein
MHMFRAAPAIRQRRTGAVCEAALFEFPKAGTNFAIPPPAFPHRRHHNSTAVFHLFLTSFQGLYLKYSSAKVMMTLSQEQHTQLWESVKTDNFKVLVLLRIFCFITYLAIDSTLTHAFCST